MEKDVFCTPEDGETMTMTMTHPNEVSTSVTMPYGLGRGGRDPNKKNLSSCEKPARAGRVVKYLLNDRRGDHHEFSARRP